MQPLGHALWKGRDDHLSFVGVRVPVRPRDQQRHPAAARAGPPADLLEQPRRCRRSVRNNQHVRLTLGHGAMVPTRAVGYLPVHVGARFWRNALIPSWASAASAFSVITTLVCSYASCSARSTWS